MKAYPFTDHDLPPRPFKTGGYTPTPDFEDMRRQSIMPGGVSWAIVPPLPWINRRQLRKRLKADRAPLQTAIERRPSQDYAPLR